MPLIFFYQEKPPTAPSPSQHVPKDPFWTSVVALFKNKNFMLLSIVYGVALAEFAAFSTIMDPVLSYFHHESFSFLGGFLFITGGCVGAFVIGYVADKTLRFKFLLYLIQFGASYFLVVFCLCLVMDSEIAVMVLVFFAGFLTIPVIPVGFEFATELTFPMCEAMSAGFLMLVG